MRRKKKGNMISRSIKTLSHFGKGGSKKTSRLKKLFVVSPGVSSKRRY